MTEDLEPPPELETLADLPFHVLGRHPKPLLVGRVRNGAVEATIDRDGLWTTQTPQVFTRALLWEAHEKARRDGFAGTDDAMLVERLGTTVAMVPGLEQNLKITTREDLRTARGWARPRRRA